MARITVVISAYNAAAYIGETLASVLSQDVPDLEIIVVDDASNDGTGDVVRQFPPDRVRYARLDRNSGYAARPRNVGIRMSSGSMIATCDADDLLTPGSLAARAALLEAHPALGVVFSDGVRFHDDGRVEPVTVQHAPWRAHFAKIPKTCVGPGQFVIAAADAYHGLAVGNFMAPTGSLYPRAVFDDVGLFDESLGNGDDLEMYFRVARRYDVGYVDVVGYRYRVHETSISRRGARLFPSRIAVLERQLALDLPARTRREIERSLAGDYASLAYAEQVGGRPREARGHYARSLSVHRTGAALRGLLTTFLGRRVYALLRRERA